MGSRCWPVSARTGALRIWPVYVLGREPGTTKFRPRSPRFPDDEFEPGLLLARLEGRLFFLNAERVGDKLRELVAETKRAGQTVFMSSHVLSEVQQSADRVGIVRDGRLVAVEAVETLRRRAVRRVVIEFDDPVPAEAFGDVDGVTDVVVHDAQLRCRLAGRADGLVKAAARFPVATITVEDPDLEELFLAYYGAGEASDAA